MRPHGHARVSRTNPQAWAVCDRCYELYNHAQLRFQYQWQGPRLQNIRLLVCPTCYDQPQEQLRTIVLPSDPVPIQNARPEFPVHDDNPRSGTGVTGNFLLPQYGAFIGNLTNNGGLPSAFDANLNKPSWLSAGNAISNSSYQNYIGVNWAGRVDNLAMPSSLMPPVLRYSVTSFTAVAPNDRSFLGTTATSYVVQGSPTNTSLYGAWTTISSGATAGTPGETISGDCAGALYQFHRIAFQGDGVNPVTVAQLQFNVAQIGEIATAGSS